MKIFRNIMLTIFFIVAGLALTVFLFMQQAVFGKDPTGERLSRIQQSSNYREGAFQNLSITEVMPKDASTWEMLKDFFNKPKTVEPSNPMPTVKTDLKALTSDKPTIVWFGHSSYLIKSKETTILVDPVFSGSASPVSFFGQAFAGADAYSVEDLPEIDMLFISHDHYDHLDFNTITKLIPKVKKVYTALGVGAHLEYWGFKKEQIVEFDWWDTLTVNENIHVTATPARHFSGRGFTRGRTLWASFALKINGYNIFIGGDSGFDTHFKSIGTQCGPFDIAILENGQYGKNWAHIHTTPEETAQAAIDLQAKVLMPVHWAKFALAYHPWNEPINRLKAKITNTDLKITTPIIGEPVVLDSLYPQTKWWDIE